MLKIMVDISMIFQDENLLNSVYRSLEPDNISFPDGISFKMNRLGKTLIFNLTSKNEILSLLSTIDDLIESIQITCNTLNSLKVR